METCHICGRNGHGDPLDKHHIFGAANRKLSERLGLKVPLCHDRCHETGPEAVHNNAEVAERLHKWGQRLAMKKLAIDRRGFALLFGKNYLEDDEPDELMVELEGEGFVLLEVEYLPAADWVC